MKWAAIAVMSIMLGGCATLPPFLQRWADLDISSAHLHREDSKTGEAFLFSQDGLVEASPNSDDAPRVRWRVRGAWLKIDTTNDGTFQTRMRALSFTKDQIIAVSPTGKRSVWQIVRVVVVIKMVPQRPGLWMP
jgi:hypothetical protein